MKATIYAKPHFQLTLSAEEADAIIEAARHHYDLTCRMLIVPGPGACLNALNQMRKDAPLTSANHVNYHITLSSRELDLVCKCLEPYAEFIATSLNARLYRALLTLLQSANGYKVFEENVAEFGF